MLKDIGQSKAYKFHLQSGIISLLSHATMMPTRETEGRTVFVEIFKGGSWSVNIYETRGGHPLSVKWQDKMKMTHPRVNIEKR